MRRADSSLGTLGVRMPVLLVVDKSPDAAIGFPGEPRYEDAYLMLRLAAAGSVDVLLSHMLLYVRAV